jgi:phage terminase Nu1 subunit (DNA packaging protein)
MPKKSLVDMANLDIPPLPPERVTLKIKPFDIETATKPELDKEFVRKRIKRTEALTVSVELELARARGELIERDLAVKQLQYLMVTTRQRLLAIPTSLARQLQHKEDIREIHGILQRAIYEALNELKDLPNKVTDPHWLEKMDEDEEGK